MSFYSGPLCYIKTLRYFTSCHSRSVQIHSHTMKFTTILKKKRWHNSEWLLNSKWKKNCNFHIIHARLFLQCSFQFYFFFQLHVLRFNILFTGIYRKYLMLRNYCKHIQFGMYNIWRNVFFKKYLWI